MRVFKDVVIFSVRGYTKKSDKFPNVINLDRRPTTLEIREQCQGFDSFYCLIGENRKLFCVDLSTLEERYITGSTNLTGFVEFVGNSREKFADYWRYIKYKEDFCEIRNKYLHQAIEEIKRDVEWMDFDDEEEQLCFAGNSIMILVDDTSEHVFPLSKHTFKLPNLDNIAEQGTDLYKRFNYFLPTCFWVAIKSEKECHLFGNDSSFHRIIDARHLRRILCNPHLGQDNVLTTIEDSI